MALIGYARVSTRSQKEEAQEDMLTAAGCERLFVDKVSGKLASRAEWDACRDYLRSGDTLVVTRFARVARNLRNLLELSNWLSERGMHLKVLMQDIDTTTPHGRLLFHVLGAVDEFQADIIAENTKEGLAAARARGRHGGRPSVLTGHKLQVAPELYRSGEYSAAAIAKTLGVSRASIYRHLTRPGS